MNEFENRNNEQARKLSELIKQSKIIKKLNSLPGKFSWEYISKYDFYTYDLKLLGDNFFSRRIIRIRFNTATLDSSIDFYVEERTPEGTIEKPVEVDFYVFQEVSSFLGLVIKQFRLFDKKKKFSKEMLYEEKTPECVQTAFDIFGKDFVKVIGV